MQAAFEKIIEKLEVAGKTELIANGGRCNGKTLALGYTKGISDAIEIVKQEAEQYNNGWIPCSERLPENISTVILQVKEIEKPTFGWYGNIIGWKLTVEDFLKLKDFTVVAWQPLPQPFQKGE